MTENHTLKQLQARYPNDDACLLSILHMRHGDADVCPKCGIVSKLSKIEGRRAYACKEGCHVYPCAGTIFEHSSTPLTLWFRAMDLMTAAREDISAKELQRQLGVTYKCAWRIGRQLRELITARAAAGDHSLLSANAELNEPEIDDKGKSSRANRSADNAESVEADQTKTMIFGMLKHGGSIKSKTMPP